jgi:hypothetical protein
MDPCDAGGGRFSLLIRPNHATQVAGGLQTFEQQPAKAQATNSLIEPALPEVGALLRIGGPAFQTLNEEVRVWGVAVHLGFALAEFKSPNQTGTAAAWPMALNSTIGTSCHTMRTSCLL